MVDRSAGCPDDALGGSSPPLSSEGTSVDLPTCEVFHLHIERTGEMYSAAWLYRDAEDDQLALVDGDEWPFGVTALELVTWLTRKIAIDRGRRAAYHR